MFCFLSLFPDHMIVNTSSMNPIQTNYHSLFKKIKRTFIGNGYQQKFAHFHSFSALTTRSRGKKDWGSKFQKRVSSLNFPRFFFSFCKCCIYTENEGFLRTYLRAENFATFQIIDGMAVYKYIAILPISILS